MDALNLILNLTGLVLWLGWRPAGVEVLDPGLAAARGQGARFRLVRWGCLAVLALLLAGRSWLYWRMGRDVGWVARLDLGVTVLDFNSAVPARMAAFSVASFAVFLGAWFAGLALLHWVNRRVREANPWLRAIAAQLGFLSRVPAVACFLVPVVVLGVAWAAAHPMLEAAGMVAPLRSGAHAAQQALVVGLGVFVAWRYLVVAILFAHVLNSHLYLGHNAFFGWLGLTARSLLRPLAALPLKAGQVDLAPVAGIAAALGACALLEHGLARLLVRLPL